MITVVAKTWEQWRTEARRLRLNDIPPESICFIDNDDQSMLFGSSVNDSPDLSQSETTNQEGKIFRVSRDYLNLAETVAHHRNPDRWSLFYRTLWRLTTSEPNLLEVVADDDVYRLLRMEKSVRRDAHKMKAFVRFRKIDTEGAEHFVAWHHPDHRIVRLVAPFFSRRFTAMNWSILTPDESVTWDQQKLRFADGVPRTQAPTEDALEELWLTYYANIFNPARVKVKAMKAEMPVRHWPTLPETQLIAGLLNNAPKRVDEMVNKQEGFSQSAMNFMTPGQSQKDLRTLAMEAAHCQACDLYRDATQTVFGEGPPNAKIVLVGEQPGDQEDVAGTPFVGPAGKVLDDALREAGINRE